MPEITRDKILVGRKAIDAYREAHRLLHQKPYYRGIHADHTPLLEKLVADLEGQGFTSKCTGFEPKKTKILTKFWAESDELNIKELGFANKEDFRAKATNTDKESLKRMWH